ncbi:MULTISPECIES: SMI1/KNR4 family protein [unclassified Haematospirillum]|uniref:SMI1/KNR4 family protein n=1 Tax=unclassified Haematospirillum TaxID=2622088 RepID=UPI001438980F|nr:MULTISPECIES: SMI1/KNR4 family protein [unclassified Haematospirillum]NKD55997.1 SMI1/KNR4 family protein [Haematospirillum sp. H4890]NKD76024.1 SMI1/KNR4 family protein [Haematospirillum sp. H4485]
MGIEQITELLPVPEKTTESAVSDWYSISAALQCEFPSDYKLFISTYGTGVIGGFLWILNPFSSNSNLNLEKALYFRHAYQQMKEKFPTDYAREVDTFLPWGVTDNGDSLVWLIEGENPNIWQVAIFSSDQANEEKSGLTMSDFLVALLEKKVRSSILPLQFLEAEKLFVPL